MLGLSANLNYYLFNGNVDLRKGIPFVWEYKGRDVTWPERCIQCIYVHVPEPEGCEDTSLRTRFLCALRETSCYGKVQETCVWWSFQMLPDTVVWHGLPDGKHRSGQDVCSRPLKSPFLKVCRNTRCTFFGHKKEGANFDTPSSVFYSLSVHYPINRNTGEINQRLYIRVASW